ncbi:MAG: VWA domain-containing protein [Chloroflexi bacterium]|nr:VWA domain-containing protein [Chloroflexota bacterium]
MQADYVLNYDVLSVAREHQLYVMARIKGKTAPDAKERPPLNVSVVLDRSGSMAGDKLDYARKAIEFLVQHLTPRDCFSLVSYDKSVKVDFAPTNIDNKDEVIQAVRKIRAGSTTNLSGGWLQGCHLVSTAEQITGQVNRVLLLSDGLANEGITDPQRLASMARQKRNESITTSTMGVGMGFNEDLMNQMAVEGGGAFYFIDDPDQAPTIFAEELRGLLTVVAQNLTITVETTNDVKMVRQMNMYTMEHRSGNPVFLMGDLFGDETKLLVLELHVPALKQLGMVDIAMLKFEFDEIVGDIVKHQIFELPININTVPKEDFEKAEPNQEVVKQMLLLDSAHARQEAMKYADEGDFPTATNVLNRAAQRIMETGVLDEELMNEHNALREEAVNMELGSERYDSRTRKTMMSTISYSTTRLWAKGKADTHDRLRRSRPALERHQDAPTVIMWGDRSINLVSDKLTIGRHSGNDIVIDEPEVSEVHCQIVRRGDDYYLEDLNSTNGTFANGGQVAGHFRLSVGDVFTVGSQMFMAR